MLQIKTGFNPFKMKISRREPVVLSLEVSNPSRDPEIVSIEVNLGKQFSLERTGYKTETAEKIPEFKPGETKKYYYELWPKQIMSEGDQVIKVTVTEHYKGFNYIKKKYDKILRLAVEE